MAKILMVDDARAVRRLINKILRDDFELAEAVDGEDGLAKLQEFAPDVVLLDVTMPVMGGKEMLKRMRARGDRTRVILLSSESGAQIDALLAIEGVCGFISKPFKPSMLRAQIAEALGAAEAAREAS